MCLRVQSPRAVEKPCSARRRTAHAGTRRCESRSAATRSRDMLPRRLGADNFSEIEVAGEQPGKRDVLGRWWLSARPNRQALGTSASTTDQLRTLAGRSVRASSSRRCRDLA